MTLLSQLTNSVQGRRFLAAVLFLGFSLLTPPAIADVLVPFDANAGNPGWHVDGRGRPKMSDSYLSALEQALVSQTGHRINKEERLLLARVDDAGRRFCEAGAVWFGAVSSERTIDAVFVCDAPNPIPSSLHFSDGRPEVTSGAGMFAGCFTAGRKPCPVQVTALPSFMPGMRDVYVRSFRGCYLFFWVDKAGPAQLGEVPCKDTLSEVTAERDICLSDGGTLHTAFMRGSMVCTRPTRDAGKSCTDGSQCEGLCVGEGEAKYGDAAIGKCTAARGPAMRCRTVVQNGRIQVCAIVD
jgi:hypothetical protein